MDDMDVDHVVDIPDTPDRITAQAQLGRESNSSVAGYSRNSYFRDKEGSNRLRIKSRLVPDEPDTPDGITTHQQLVRESNSSVTRHSRNSDFRDKEGSNRLMIRSRLFRETEHDRRLGLNPQNTPLNKSISFSPAVNSYPSQSQKISLFRRGAMVNSKPEASNVVMESGEKGNAERKPMSQIDKYAIIDQNFPQRATKSHQAQETKDAQVSSNGGSSFHYFEPMLSNNNFKGKEKLIVASCNDSRTDKGIDLSGTSQPKMKNPVPASHPSVSSPRVTGQKRLVRNGCISPHNIATRAQVLAESRQTGPTVTGKDNSSDMAPDGPPAGLVDIGELVAEENNFRRAKGKGPVTRFHALKDDEAKALNVSTRHCEERDGNGNISGNARDSMDQGDARETCRHMSGLHQRSQSHHIGNGHTKRQKKLGLTSRNHSECSTIVLDEPENLSLGSSLESSSSRSSETINMSRSGSSRTLNRQRRCILDPIYEIDDDPLPETRNDNSQGISTMDDDPDARARQVEADEILARELQEQLYHEVPLFGSSEIDENLAWVLQHEEDAFPVSSAQNRPISRVRRSSTIQANRQPQLQFFQSSSNRRGSQARVPPTRSSQLRSRLFNRPPATVSRTRNASTAALPTARNFHFPLGMDLDMRLDILEALEEFNDMSMTARHILQAQDFNENDYEMLLALDENNHERGASANRINNLPESVVQTENFEETCAICLETPTTGEAIRHLPCLHKFHKDCIDPWLRRKTTCPVCKSSIT